MASLVLYGNLTNTKVMEILPIEKDFLQILENSGIPYQYLMRDYHTLDISDLVHELSVTRQNLAILPTEIRRKMKSYIYEIELFLNKCEQHRWNVSFDIIEEEQDDQ